ncbi:hypothetical protein SLU01_00820 [Sporosarcina luteola]|uniref:BIG2 domain-containing protein n=1 Tax=Sporosarcina luteola TaxID=582850 RepID=A0A511Z2U7_9BACL|nr:S8 family serine peptidase [Sporosarcina luteola]GEN81770.1 hypothetical protein SLU01_00820 [Sporosarcina luteola]
MKKHSFAKLLSTFLAFVLVLSMLTPYTVSANSDPTGAAETSATNATKTFKEDLSDEKVMQQKAAVAEQLDLLGGEAKLHEQLQNIKGNQQVPVIIHLSEKSVGLQTGLNRLSGRTLSKNEAQQVKQKVRNQQINVKKEMVVKGIQFTEGFTYDTVLNGMSGTVRADDLPKLLDVKGVTLVEPDTILHASELGKSKELNSSKGLKKPAPSDSKLEEKGKAGQVDAQMDTSIGFLGIKALWNEGYEGQGIKVAVLDTGIDADHPDFQGIYKGGKNFIPNSGTYTRPRADDDASETSPVERPAGTPEFNDRGSSFYTSHGTHVAGTIAAIGNNEFGIKGIAPKVDLYAYRVLGAYGSGATSGIIKAIDTAVIEEMHVINLSLGGGANTETDAGSFAINNAMLAGTISVIATGNSGPNRGTMGTPGTARLGIAVGNTTNPEANYSGEVNIISGSYNLSKTLNLMGTTYGQDLATQLNGEYSIVAVPGIGQPSDYAGLDVDGKVALVSRGDIAFVDKIAAAKGEGAIAIIVHNFAGGTGAPGVSGTFLGDDFEFIPTFDMSQTDGDAIRAALKQAEGTISFGNFSKTMTTGDEVNDSSSRGPSTPNFDIKPDVSAPGTNIMSTIPMYKADFPEATYEKAFTRKTGTSMATPHIAGIAALVKQANPSWDAFDVKVALSNTAKVLDTGKYDVFAQGAGRVQAYAAAHPEILAYAIDIANNDGETVENKKGTVTFGPHDLKMGDVEVTKQILVKNANGKGGNYNATVQLTKAFAGATVTIDKPSFTLSGEQLLNVTLKAPKNANVKAGDEILGYINIKGGDTEVSLPFAADFGGEAAVEIKDMEITETDLSFNGDGVKDEAMLYFTITGDVSTNFLELWDIMDPEGGVYDDGYIGYLHAGNALGAGSYQLAIKGNYTPWDGTGSATIPDGLYTIDYTAQTVSGNPPVIGDYVGPIVVKSEAGTIEGTVEGTTANGQIDDAYIAYQAELVNYGMGYDINTKLKATYEVIKEGEVIASGPVKLAQDGKFSFDLPQLNKKDNSVKVKYEDAAGNKAEAVIYKAGDEVEEEISYKINYTSLALEIGESKQLTVTETTPTTENDVTDRATFTSANEAVATVKNGLVKAVGAGKTNITVTYKNFTTTVAVEVAEKAVDTVSYSVNKSKITLEAGKKEQLTVTETTTKADGSIVEKDVTSNATFKSGDKAVATVHKGLVTAVGPGKTDITVTLKDFTATVAVEVTEKAVDVVTYSVNKTNLTLEVGQKEQLTVTETTKKADGSIVEKDVTANAKFVPANKAVVTLNKGLVTAKGAGKTDITVTHKDFTATVAVEVTDKEKDIVTYSVNKTALTLEEGQQEQLILTETTKKADGSIVEKNVTADAKFVPANKAVVTLKKGLVTAVAPGKTTITVTHNEFKTLVTVQVTEKAVDIVKYSVNKTQMTLGVGEQEQLYVTETTLKPDGSIIERDVTGSLRYNVMNNNYATVQKGLVTAIEAGMTQVRVLIDGHETIIVYLTVTQKPQYTTTYSINLSDVYINVGQQEQLYVTETIVTADGNVVSQRDVTGDLSYKVIDNSVATVKKGLVTGLKAGKSQLRIEVKDQNSGELKETIYAYITVMEPQPDKVTYELNRTNMKMEVGEQKQLKVTETTVTPAGVMTQRDVTVNAKFKVVNNTIATVSKGLVSAHKPGKTQVNVTLPDGVNTFVYLEVTGQNGAEDPSTLTDIDSTDEIIILDTNVGFTAIQI